MNKIVQDRVTIICEVCAHRFGTSVSLMKTKSRDRESVRARFLAYYFFKNYLLFTLAECGAVFNRDHSSVLYGLGQLKGFVDIKTEGVVEDLKHLRNDLKNSIDYTFTDMLTERFPNTWKKFTNWTSRKEAAYSGKHVFSQFNFTGLHFDLQAKVFARFIYFQSKGKVDVSPIFDLYTELAKDAVTHYFDYFENRAGARQRKKYYDKKKL